MGLGMEEKKLVQVKRDCTSPPQRSLRALIFPCCLHTIFNSVFSIHMAPLMVHYIYCNWHRHAFGLQGTKLIQIC